MSKLEQIAKRFANPNGFFYKYYIFFYLQRVKANFCPKSLILFSLGNGEIYIFST